jgi:hypothetical protein
MGNYNTCNGCNSHDCWNQHTGRQDTSKAGLCHEVHELKQDIKEIKIELKDHDKRLAVLETKNTG